MHTFFALHIKNKIDKVRLTWNLTFEIDLFDLFQQLYRSTLTNSIRSECKMTLYSGPKLGGQLQPLRVYLLEWIYMYSIIVQNRSKHITKLHNKFSVLNLKILVIVLSGYRWADWISNRTQTVSWRELARNTCAIQS